MNVLMKAEMQRKMRMMKQVSIFGKKKIKGRMSLLGVGYKKTMKIEEDILVSILGSDVNEFYI